MNCNTFSDLLDAFMEGSLPKETAAEMRSHAAECPACAALMQLRLDCRALDEETEVPSDFSTAWRQRIREEEEKEKRASARRWRGYLAMAAALVFVAGGVLLTRNAGQFSGPDTAVNVPRPTGMLTAERPVLSNAAPAYSGESAQEKQADVPLLAAAYSAPEEAAEEMDMASGAVQDAEEGISPAEAGDVSFTVSTADFDAAVEALRDLTERLGGQADELSFEEGASGNRSCMLMLRIPVSAVDTFLAEVRAIVRTDGWMENGLPKSGSAVLRVTVLEEEAP